MSMHINKFVDRLRGFEARGAKDFIMSINDAKDLHSDITRLLLELNDVRKSVMDTPAEETITKVQISGGSFL